MSFFCSIILSKGVNIALKLIYLRGFFMAFSSIKFSRSQRTHDSLADMWHSKSNSGKNRAFGNYHSDCYDTQSRIGRVLKKSERKKLFSWWWNYEVLDKKTSYPKFK